MKLTKVRKEETPEFMLGKVHQNNSNCLECYAPIVLNTNTKHFEK